MVKEHHLPDGRFANPWPGWRDITLPMVLKWQWNSKSRPSTGWLLESPNPAAHDVTAAFPVHRPDIDALQHPPGSEIQAVWLGHATTLVQMDGVTFITDPVLSDQASPSRHLGPKRMVRAPIEVTDPEFPSIDFVVLSHNHYDHLDYTTVGQIYKRWGDKVVWYVPLKLEAWFTNLGITNVIEMDWWDEVRHQDSTITITMTPAQHWSMRSMTLGGFDKNKTLWGGYAIKGSCRSFWFPGDTGYCPVFAEIGRRLGPFDLCAIPIGAYQPRSIWQFQHCDPEEAIRIHQVLLVNKLCCLL